MEAGLWVLGKDCLPSQSEVSRSHSLVGRRLGLGAGQVDCTWSQAKKRQPGSCKDRASPVSFAEQAEKEIRVHRTPSSSVQPDMVSVR